MPPSPSEGEGGMTTLPFLLVSSSHNSSKRTTRLFMASAPIECVRCIFYFFDFVFGVFTWVMTAAVLSYEDNCRLTKRYLSGNTAPCHAAIALGVVATIVLLVIIVFRTLDVAGRISFPELIETISLGVVTLMWLSVAIVVVSVSNPSTREWPEVYLTIAGAWAAFVTHAISTIISVCARR